MTSVQANLKINSLESIKFSSDGKTFYILDSKLKNLRSFTLSTAWDLTSTVLATGSQKISVIESSPKALCVDTANNIALVSGLLGEKVTQFSLDHSLIEVVSNSTAFDGDVFAAGSIQIDGDLSLTNNINASNLLSERVNNDTSIESGSSFIIKSTSTSSSNPNTSHSVDVSSASEVNLNSTSNGNFPPHSVYLPGHTLNTGDRVFYSKNLQDPGLNLTGYHYAIVTGEYVQFANRLSDALAIPPTYKSLYSGLQSNFSGHDDHTFKEMKEEIKITGQDIEIGGSAIADSTISISNVGSLLSNNYINFNDRANPATTTHINVGNQSLSNPQNVNIGSAQSTTAQNINLYGEINMQGSSRASGDGTHNRAITIGGQYTKGTITLGKSELTNTINVGSSITAGNTQNINIGTSSAGTTNISLGKFTLPTSDGSANQVLKTDGNGNLDFVDQSSGNAIAVKDEGTSLTAAASTIDFAGAGVTATESDGTVTVTVPGPASSGDIDILTGSLSDTQFKAKDGKRLLKISSGGSYEIDLFQPTASDIGKSWTVINADSSGSTSYSGILIDSNGQRVRFMSGSTNYAYGTSVDATVHRGGIAEIVCVAATANGGTNVAPNFIIYGSGIVIG